MWDCNICRKWVERKKREVADLVTSRVRQARLNNLLLQKEDTIQEYIFGRINETEETITELKADDPDVNESDLEPTITRENTHQFPQARDNEEDASLNDTPKTMETSQIVNSADHSYATGQLHTPLPMSQLKIGSTEAYTFYEGPDFLTLTHEDSITKYKAELNDFLPEEIHSMLNSSIYDSLRQGWWRDRLYAMSKGVTAFREEIREGAALITEYDLFEPTLDSDGEPIPSKYLACLFSSHPLFWSIETNNRCGSICPFHKCHSLWWEASEVDDVFGEDQCQTNCTFGLPQSLDSTPHSVDVERICITTRYKWKRPVTNQRHTIGG
jgi:hypothetical protein